MARVLDNIGWGVVSGLLVTDDPDEEPIELPEELDWLVDVPLFIDQARVDELLDIIENPPEEVYVPQPKDLETAEQNESELGGKLSGNLTTSISPLFKAALRATGHTVTRQAIEEATSYSLVSTPPRKLIQIALEYQSHDQELIHINQEPWDIVDHEWENVEELPRPLVFLELPSLIEVRYNDGPEDADAPTTPVETKLVPTAAEFEDGAVELIYSTLGPDDRKPPKYPEIGDEYEFEGGGEEVILNNSNIINARKEYWGWFNRNFKASRACEQIEEAAENHGDIRWIDFRLPLNQAGATLHLHLQPREQYNTGTFAYNFVKRGFKHGLRLVGTIKSEPDMDVLAVYER